MSSIIVTIVWMIKKDENNRMWIYQALLRYYNKVEKLQSNLRSLIEKVNSHSFVACILLAIYNVP